MNYIKLYEDFLNEDQSFKFSWKQYAKSYGKSSIGYDNNLRGWQLNVNGEMVAFLKNSGYLASTLGGDNLDQWSVHFVSKQGPNFTMKRRFQKDQLEDAKRWTEKLYTDAANTPDDSEDANMKSLKGKMYFPVKVAKASGPFKELFKKLKSNFYGFTYTFGPDSSFKNFRYGKNFNDTGEMMWAGSGKPTEEMMNKIKDAIGPEYDVEENNRVVKFKIKTNENLYENMDELKIGSVYKIYDKTNNGKLWHGAAKLEKIDAKGFHFKLANLPKSDPFIVTAEDSENKYSFTKLNWSDTYKKK